MSKFLTFSLRKAIVGGLALLVLALVIGLSVRSPEPVIAGPADNVIGFAWSDMPDGSDQTIQGAGPNGRGAGWISMNSTDINSAVDYGVNINMATGYVDGFAWSEHMGWIDFTGVTMNPATGKLSGNAQALAGGTAQSGGWDGVISMSSAAGQTPAYGVSVVMPTGTSTANTAGMTGYAWGDMVMGWIDFSDVQVTLTPQTACTDTYAVNYTAPGPNITSDNSTCLYGPNVPCRGVCPTWPGSFVCKNNPNLTVRDALVQGLTVTQVPECYAKGDQCINDLVHPGIQTITDLQQLIANGWVQTADNYCVQNPGTAEICGNGIDDDLDGDTDEGCTGTITIPTFEEI